MAWASLAGARPYPEPCQGTEFAFGQA